MKHLERPAAALHDSPLEQRSGPGLRRSSVRLLLRDARPDPPEVGNGGAQSALVHLHQFLLAHVL
eukprot:9126793-Alexandrium_andersonii.AAC.1